MSRKKTFRVQSSLPEEEKIKRRAAVFGLLTIILGIVIIVWGVPFFVKVVGILGDLKSEKEAIVEEDTIPPPVPRFSYIPEATNSATLPISGFTEPKVQVKIRFNNEEISTESDEEGNFLLKRLVLNTGVNTVLVWAEDQSGNQSETTKSFEILYDTQEPELKIETPSDKNYVEEQTIDVKGETEPGARILVNEHVVVVDEEGRFSTRVTLKEGGNEITVVSQDKAGNETREKFTITYLP